MVSTRDASRLQLYYDAPRNYITFMGNPIMVADEFTWNQLLLLEGSETTTSHEIEIYDPYPGS